MGMRRLTAAFTILACSLVLTPEDGSSQRRGSLGRTLINSSHGGATASRGAGGSEDYRGLRGGHGYRGLRGGHGYRGLGRRPATRHPGGVGHFPVLRGLHGHTGFHPFPFLHAYPGLQLALRLDGFFFTLSLPDHRRSSWRWNWASFSGATGRTASPDEEPGEFPPVGRSEAHSGPYWRDVRNQPAPDDRATTGSEGGELFELGGGEGLRDIRQEAQARARDEGVVTRNADCAVVEVHYRGGSLVTTWVSLPTPGAANLNELRSQLESRDRGVSGGEGSPAVDGHMSIPGSSVESISVAPCGQAPSRGR